MYHRILICGDRNWNNYTFFLSAMQKWIGKHGLPEVVIEGCAEGADKMAGHIWVPEINKSLEDHYQFSDEIDVEHYPALWSDIQPGDPVRYRRDGTPYNPAAGPRRNQQMLTEGRPDAVIAFHENLAASKGTGDMVRRARKAGLPVWVPVKQPQQGMNL